MACPLHKRKPGTPGLPRVWEGSLRGCSLTGITAKKSNKDGESGGGESGGGESGETGKHPHGSPNCSSWVYLGCLAWGACMGLFIRFLCGELAGGMSYKEEQHYLGSFPGIRS